MEKMRDDYWFNLFIIFSISYFLFKFIFSKKANSKNLPPGPRALPVIGHLHLLKKPVHRSLDDLSKKYGHVMFFRFGNRKVVVVSSPKAVEECFTKNDLIFANRPRVLAGKYLSYNNTTMGFANYGDHWRNLRRLMNLELFSTRRMSTFTGVRQDEVKLLMKQIFKAEKVNLKSKFTDISFNIMLRIIAGKRYYGKAVVDEEARQFQEIISESVEIMGSSNLGDYLPVFQWVDVQGVKKKMVRLMKKMDKFYQFLLEEHRSMRSTPSTGSKEERKQTLIDVMLSLQETDPKSYSEDTIKGVIMAMLIAGTETAAVTLEWGMSLLLNNPESMKKAFAEIETHVGTQRFLEEQDLPKLTYLQNIVNETLRLFPAGPLLMPHLSSDDTTICGFDIPRGTMLMVNAWTLQRDPEVWEDPEKFKPERFEGEGEGYKLIPFGVGRRACPGNNLANIVLLLALGTLIQCYEWERVGKEELDMMEGTGLSIPKAIPLEALCKPRQAMIDLLSNI